MHQLLYRHLLTMHQVGKNQGIQIKVGFASGGKKSMYLNKGRVCIRWEKSKVFKLKVGFASGGKKSRY